MKPPGSEKVSWNSLELTGHFRWLHCLQFGHCFDFSISITFLWQWDDSKREENELFWKIGTSICTLFFSWHHISITFLWQFDGIIHSAIFFKTHFHTIVMKMWWNSRPVLIFKNWAITFSSHIYDNEMMLKDHNFTDIFHSKLISLHLK